MTTQTVQIVSFDYGSSLSSVTLRNLSDDSLVATADTCNEVTADSGVYAAVFGETAVIPAGTYRLRAVVSGAPLNRYVTLAGTDGEVVQSSSVPPGQGLTTFQATQLTATKTAVDALGVALAGMSPVEPTGTTVFQHLEQIQDSIDTYVSSALATVNGTQDTIVGFPDSLTVGDSYTEDSGNAIHVFIRDGNDDPISSVGSHGFTDSDFTPELVITNSGNAGRVRATVTYIDPGSSEPYLKVEIPLAESRRAAPGSATMQCVLKWNGCAKTLATQSVTWVARI